ncbi:hypothetical protein MPC4_180088 [Methylocella tundrae]|uniref:Uncharacterized protein n=1 Tax=Methylocella tundrae TaxID=227605 RepID=A0A8B6M6G6_METTU|nr:hypothetical protein MPC1_1480004 [Methylocella tundrae]VTZ49682.1 hypothetical protein MPC4_180088 [Methylocella tundrae]
MHLCRISSAVHSTTLPPLRGPQRVAQPGFAERDAIDPEALFVARTQNASGSAADGRPGK